MPLEYNDSVAMFTLINSIIAPFPQTCLSKSMIFVLKQLVVLQWWFAVICYNWLLAANFTWHIKLFFLSSQGSHTMAYCKKMIEEIKTKLLNLEGTSVPSDGGWLSVFWVKPSLWKRRRMIPVHQPLFACIAHSQEAWISTHVGLFYQEWKKMKIMLYE